MYTFCVGWPAGLRNYIWRETIIFLGLRAFEGRDQGSGHQEGKDQQVRGEGLSGCREERDLSPGERKGKEAGGKPQVTLTPVATARWWFPATCQDMPTQRAQRQEDASCFAAWFIVGHREAGFIGLCFARRQVP